MIEKAHACQTPRATIAVHAQLSFVRMLSANSGMPDEDLGQRVREEELEHVADHQDGQHVRDEEDAPPEVARFDLRVEPERDRQRDHVREDRRDDGEQEREPVRVQDAVVLEQVDVVRETDEVPVPVARIVREAEEDADQHRECVEQGERDDRGPHHPVEGGRCPFGLGSHAGGPLACGAARRRRTHRLCERRHVTLPSLESCERLPWPTHCRGWRVLPPRRR